jgi:hypothetical protein
MKRMCLIIVPREFEIIIIIIIIIIIKKFNKIKAEMQLVFRWCF